MQLFISPGWLEVLSGDARISAPIFLAYKTVIGRLEPEMETATPRPSLGEFIGLSMRDEPLRLQMSRRQAQITYDTENETHAIKNVGRFGTHVTVDNMPLGQGAEAALQNGSIIYMFPNWKFKFHIK